MECCNYIIAVKFHYKIRSRETHYVLVSSIDVNLFFSIGLVPINWTSKKIMCFSTNTNLSSIMAPNFVNLNTKSCALKMSKKLIQRRKFGLTRNTNPMYEINSVCLKNGWDGAGTVGVEDWYVRWRVS